MLLRDRDSKYSAGFDEIFPTEGAEILKSPLRAPNANAHAERWVRTIRQECLDHLLIIPRRHLEAVLAELEAIAAVLNGRPRKTLGWKTPAEALNEHLLLATQGGVATTD